MIARRLAVLALTAAVAALPVRADHNPDSHSSMSKLFTYNAGGKYRQGSDLAFWGTTAVLGNYDNPGGFRLLDISDPADPKQLGQFACPGRQGDVSIWENLVFVSVDTPLDTEDCANARRTNAAEDAANLGWEGIRIVSIADPANPVQIEAVRTDCGSHTHTLVPDPTRHRVLLYVLSYPLVNQGAACNPATHQKISVVEVPLDEPENASVLNVVGVRPAVGCHDVTVHLERAIAAAACITESQIWDISNPAAPEVVAHIPHPSGMDISHSTVFSNDGNVAVIGAELGGALATPGCITGGSTTLGALFFYDVSNAFKPVYKGYYQLQQVEPSVFCTAHNFNTVPLRDDRDVLVSAFYNGGTAVIDFTDPTKPKQLGYYTPRHGGLAAAWSSYWYNGHIYVNNFDEDVNSVSSKSRGLDVLTYDGDELDDALHLRRLNPQTQEASFRH